ncbi:RNA polymerase sigma factor [Methylobrevis pamukkalensis]|uniref:ECF RNA polymerase sigma factor SigH n=1 Tax=Methylobrevis pamukkalensis TaxID=1439726 RepID=A0A1E3H1S2_9HYPH|nr:RNA polymerase sigma factor [Methylobrevis pamukkalensis]ODN70279.1 ECF RNA polymerase sigma factor SigH [Methylobrevis pamukkalensis]
MTSNIGPDLVALLPRLRRYALSLTRDGGLADDLVQGACEKALAGARSWTPGTRFDAWMFRILRNLWIDGLRRRRTEGIQDHMDDHEDIVGTDGNRETEMKLMFADVARAIDDLPTDQREVLLLTCAEDLSYREAAEVLGVPIGTVMSRLARARRRLSEATGAEPGMGN